MERKPSKNHWASYLVTTYQVKIYFASYLTYDFCVYKCIGIGASLGIGVWLRIFVRVMYKDHKLEHEGMSVSLAKLEHIGMSVELMEM